MGIIDRIARSRNGFEVRSVYMLGASCVLRAKLIFMGGLLTRNVLFGS